LFFYLSNKKKENKEKIKEKKSNPKRKIKMKSPFLDLTSLLSLDPSRSISSPYYSFSPLILSKIRVLSLEFKGGRKR